ncbi:hypothetical protein DLAC_06519 [Tieghemostelium lacteum]|uniref:Complex 1 LYR protein domain-containing protein n=1 Tax=Tieghemostelium lacteum TaxID=361077 RepID=A0A151ZEY9_TIELA|nr:hypothetical protein DLAC_06519 [Tieghemostelium lacteum]|eukprot:KYQ92528.1 hypothetical protein DLAC_06519 [Tieghemostelium lacteum]
MSGNTTSSLVLFRRIIREGSRFNGFTYGSWWRVNLRELFRENKNVSDPQQVKVLQDKTKSYRYFLKSSRDIQELLDSYNIGIPARERIEKSSARVGFKAPEWPEARDKRIQERIEQEKQQQQQQNNETK